MVNKSFDLDNPNRLNLIERRDNLLKHRWKHNKNERI